MKRLIFLFLLMLGTSSAQIDDLLEDLEEAEQIVEEAIPTIVQSLHLSESYYRLYLVFVIMGAAVLFMWLILRAIGKTKDHSSEDVISASGLVIVVMATLFIVIASTTTEALTAAIGLIGAVCGYVLGNLTKDKKKTTP